ncbi:hypothetical protein B5M09_005428 [Aphanomyces astaci]|uniref:Uncharacterized protein n=1 Tax=Aphanomyces astaci TaxID=112090 RepID=A0A425DCA6_APHAT|nr:hypothetical protein B5M09_005428 [Aphanomyces astaci]
MDPRPRGVSTGMAVVCVVCMVLDVVVNNWGLNDYIGNARSFFTPVLTKIASVKDLKDYFVFPTDASPWSSSNAGRFMLNHSLASIHARDDSHYVLTAGSYAVLDAANDICVDLIDEYPVRQGVASAQLGHVTDKLGARLFPAHGVLVHANLSMYRFYARAFCTGCMPIMELGLDKCQVHYSFNATTQSLVVHASESIFGHNHYVGMLLERSSVTTAGLWVRITCVLYLVVAFSSSRKTIRWTNGSTLTTWFKKLNHTLSPAVYRHPSRAFSFSYLCFNSDIFVGLYLIAALFDGKSSSIFSRVMYFWNKGSGNSFVVLRLWSINLRLLWFNCFVAKFMNWFLRAYGELAFALILNLLVVLCLDRVVNRIWWQHVADNSLGRQLMYNSTAIISDLGYNFVDVPHYGDAAISIPARALCTIQWFLTCYTMKFGLPEHRHKFKAMTKGSKAKPRQSFTQGLTKRYTVHNVQERIVEENGDFDDDHNVITHEMYILSQDNEGNISLYNAQHHEIQALSLEVKILADAQYTVAALCTLQWFLTSHAMRFGLPEHPEHIQSLVSKSQGQSGRSSIADKPSHGRHRPANHKRAVVYAVVESNPKLPRQQPQNEHHSPYHDDDGSKGAAAANMFMMTQDSDGPLGKTVWAMSWRVYMQAFRNSSVGYVVVTHGPNNWELNDLIGNARTLFTPVLNVASQQDLTDTFTFAEGYSLSTTSNVGLFMLNYTLQKIHAHDASMYVLTADTFLINGGTNDICGLLKQSYLVKANTTSVSLGVIEDGIQYIRGQAISNFFLGIGPPPSFGSDHDTLTSLGSRKLVIESSQAVVGHHRVLGMMLERSGVTTGSLVVRGVCVLFVLASFTTSQKTKLLHMIAPSLHRYQHRLLNLPYFCFNSDIFVVGYVTAVLLDEKACTLYSRALFRWNRDTPSSWTSWYVYLRILSMNFRWVWLNCFLVKIIKLMANFVSATGYTSRNFVVGYFNFSSITYVYVAGLALVYRHNFLDYSNSDMVALTPDMQHLDGISIDFFDSTLMRGYPGLVFVMFLNLVGVLSIDLAVNFKWWRKVSNNSLGRQHIYNSTSIITDMGYVFVDWPERPSFKLRNSAQVTVARRQSTVAADDFFMLAQDQDGYLHLFNARKTEIQALSMEVNVQADARYMVA